MPTPAGDDTYDVAVIGAGVAGVVAGILLRRAGRSVVCLDARPYPHHQVGESLDWSMPGLLRRVGLSSGTLIAERAATWKKKIVVSEIGKPDWEAAPPPPIRLRPLRFETVTLHVDRAAFDQRLYQEALALGTVFLWERVTRVDSAAGRVTRVTTSSNRQVEARWYIDASGTARVLARAMHIPWTEYGRRKVCLWTYFDTPPLSDGTTFFLDNADAYLHWIWDIPISPERTSVGIVLSGDSMQAQRRAGASNQAILRGELARHPRFAELLAAQPGFAVESTSFRPYLTSQVCGVNWLMAGEAAAMPDPLTGNGVTSAFRHARYATDAINAAGANGELALAFRRSYSRHVHRLGHAFNQHIEHAVYRHPLRQAFGMPTAAVVYTVFAFFMNALYARCDPRGPVGMAAFDLLFVAARLWVGAWTGAARLTLWFRRRFREGGAVPPAVAHGSQAAIDGSQAAPRSLEPGTAPAARDLR